MRHIRPKIYKLYQTRYLTENAVSSSINLHTTPIVTLGSHSLSRFSSPFQLGHRNDIRDKVLKSRLSKFFKGYLPQNLLSPLLYTLSLIIAAHYAIFIYIIRKSVSATDQGSVGIFYFFRQFLVSSLTKTRFRESQRIKSGC